MDRGQPLSLEEIKKRVIIALFSDDDLMDMLVLKGGNAMDIIYKITSRSSKDIDLSIENEFKAEELEIIEEKIQKGLRDAFESVGYEVFDINFTARPRRPSRDMEHFWGGYRVEFKIIEVEKYRGLVKNISSLRRQATVVGPNQKKTFMVDISKFEYCGHKIEADLEGYTIYVYSPEMLAIEKLRAICQQMPEYREIVGPVPQSARARDFFDFYTILETFPIDLTSDENKNLLKTIFAAKKVPLNLIDRIADYREYHRPDFPVVKDTVRPGTQLKDFDYYFDYVVARCKVLKPLWEV